MRRARSLFCPHSTQAEKNQSTEQHFIVEEHASLHLEKARTYGEIFFKGSVDSAHFFIVLFHLEKAIIPMLVSCLLV